MDVESAARLYSNRIVTTHACKLARLAAIEVRTKHVLRKTVFVAIVNITLNNGHADTSIGRALQKICILAVA